MPPFPPALFLQDGQRATPSRSVQDDVEVRQVLRHLRPFAVWIAVATVAATAGTYLTERRQPRVYEAVASVMSVTGARDAQALDITASAPPVTPTAVDEVVHSAALVNDIVTRLPASGIPATVTNQLTAELRTELKTRVFRHVIIQARVDQQQRGVYAIVARASSGAAAQALAGATARALLDWDAQRARYRYVAARQTLERQIARSGTLLPDSDPGGAREQLIRTVWQLKLLEVTATGTLTLVARPVTPSDPISPRPTRNAALAGLLALLGSSAAALLVQSVRRRVRSAEDLRSLGLPVLGELPLRGPPEGLVIGSHVGGLADALGYLRVQLLPLLARAPQSTVVVCAARADQGSSAVVATLAGNLGDSGLKVLIIDARGEDARQRQLWPLHVAPWVPLPGAYVNPAYGVATTLSSACRDPQIAQVARVSGNVDLLPSDRADDATDPHSGVHHAAFADLLRQWGSVYDVVIIDAPPLLDAPDALAIAPGTAGLLLVADLKVARTPELEQALNLAAMTAVPVLGGVLTRQDGWPVGARGPAAEPQGRRDVRGSGRGQRARPGANRR
ncbi:CpsD/CapB family tyrosine-protein kinase [Deinococcus sp. KSM4-11]|uniref:CpsD/CapB family tyrosine-protein kinase n=1 Tax=Deinococcus sp. KSM4-11 TaxID=2568654 RepID=UPI0010A30678|nr:CpsD/CapB family tyrosine-protein kinase [Deinococcus sp. KSM4-11]THF84029.1 CpsD/CapB family tyrosine-protein kinase [Deinococcus sp. KSM4-11]